MRSIKWLPIFALAAIPALPAGAAAPPGSVTTIYMFHGQTTDGGGPVGALTVMGESLVGATRVGGSAHSGTIFSLTRNGDGSGFQERVLYSFQGGSADGAGPVGGLEPYQGALYGVTFTGGTVNFGTLFRFDAQNGETVMHNFLGGSDGAAPMAPVIRVGSTFYGTTRIGGGTGCFDKLGCGTIFAFDAATGAETVLYAFQGGSDGAYPKGALTRVGNFLYGTTSVGGKTKCFAAIGCGTVFKYDLSASAYTQIYAFPGGASHGALPADKLTNIGGVLYGTTKQGGGNGCNGNGCGTIFSVNPADDRVFTLFANFGGANGTQPSNSLQQIIHHNASAAAPPIIHHNADALAPHGGTFQQGTLYSFDLDAHTVTPLHEFTGQKDGGVPYSELVEFGQFLYGTTYSGGHFQSGTIFRFSP